jgi:hypothetical protein
MRSLLTNYGFTISVFVAVTMTAVFAFVLKHLKSSSPTSWLWAF